MGGSPANDAPRILICSKRNEEHGLLLTPLLQLPGSPRLPIRHLYGQCVGIALIRCVDGPRDETLFRLVLVWAIQLSSAQRRNRVAQTSLFRNGIAERGDGYGVAGGVAGSSGTTGSSSVPVWRSSSKSKKAVTSSLGPSSAIKTSMQERPGRTKAGGVPAWCFGGGDFFQKKLWSPGAGVLSLGNSHGFTCVRIIQRRTG